MRLDILVETDWSSRRDPAATHRRLPASGAAGGQLEVATGSRTTTPWAPGHARRGSILDRVAP